MEGMITLDIVMEVMITLAMIMVTTTSKMKMNPKMRKKVKERAVLAAQQFK